ncbi:MAG: twin-arginine translocation signal domain-containing protein, partial [Maioricimonas sp. JB045]
MARPSGELSRRSFLEASTAGLLASGPLAGAAFAQPPGERPLQSDEVTVINPRGRVPLSFIIDDSTCLV